MHYFLQSVQVYTEYLYGNRIRQLALGCLGSGWRGVSFRWPFCLFVVFYFSRFLVFSRSLVCLSVSALRLLLFVLHATKYLYDTAVQSTLFSVFGACFTSIRYCCCCCCLCVQMINYFFITQQFTHQEYKSKDGTQSRSLIIKCEKR